MSTTTVPKIDLSTLPTEFRGCMWNDGWEFDAPCVIYYPRAYRRFKIAGNTGGIDEMIEDTQLDLCLGRGIRDGGLAGECEWRGWSMDGFARRRAAWHVVVKGRWEMKDYGPSFVVESRKETYGLPKAA